MKRIQLALLVFAGLTVVTGCGNIKENDTLIIGGADGPTSIFLSPDASETAGDEALDTAREEPSSPITGTWQTVSVAYEDNGTMYPEYYVQFSDTEIIYGHMKDDKFVKDHSDKIILYEEKEGGHYKVQAESSNGVPYTYQTSEEDGDMLEYYETWDEEEFPDAYRGGASLSRCPDQEMADPVSDDP